MLPGHSLSRTLGTLPAPVRATSIPTPATDDLSLPPGRDRDKTHLQCVRSSSEAG